MSCRLVFAVIPGTDFPVIAGLDPAILTLHVKGDACKEIIQIIGSSPIMT